MSSVRAIRGATQASANSAEAIAVATKELLLEILKANALFLQARTPSMPAHRLKYRHFHYPNQGEVNKHELPREDTLAFEFSQRSLCHLLSIKGL